jgi:DNA-binding Xre family transcriptional regulator
MVFKRLDWQKVARTKVLRYKKYSYGKLADLLKVSKSTVWKMLNHDTVNITVENFLLISRTLEINPLDYIAVDEVQLKLL